MNPAQLAINSISTKHQNLEEALNAYAAAGFKNIELFLPQAKEYSSAELQAMLDARGLKFIGGFEGILQAFADVEKRTQNRAALLKNARLMEALGGPGTCLVVGTDGPESMEGEPLATLATALGEACEIVAPHGVSLLLEFNWSPLVKSLRTAAEVARRSGAPNAGVLFDPAHYHCTPTKFDQINAATVPFIKHVHVNDMRDKPGELSNCNTDRVLPGDGCLELEELFGALEAHGYDGHFSIEMFSEELWALPAAEAARRMYQSLLPLFR